MENINKQFDARGVWKKAIEDTIILIRINKVEAQKNKGGVMMLGGFGGGSGGGGEVRRW